MRALRRLAVPAAWVLGALLAWFLLYNVWGRAALIEPPTSANVADLFPEDIVDWNDSDDHGWWAYTMNPASDQDPSELCTAIHAEMVKRFPWAVPGIGVVITEPPPTGPGIPHEVTLPDGSTAIAQGAPNHGPYWLAYCGSPDFLGRDPRGG